MTKLPLSFYQRDDVVQIAKDLLGKYVFTNVNGQVSGGMIVETEAYRGPEDRGSHAYNDKCTPRNKTMFEEGGVSYIYICYGIHDMLNIVTGLKNSSHAILIRAIEPTHGISDILKRRSKEKADYSICAGPGLLTQALGINKSFDNESLDGTKIWLEDRNNSIMDEQILCGARVGMNFTGPYKVIPWRFRIKGNKYVSRAAGSRE